MEAEIVNLWKNDCFLHLAAVLSTSAFLGLLDYLRPGKRRSGAWADDILSSCWDGGWVPVLCQFHPDD